MHPENAIDNGDFIKILVYKFILPVLSDPIDSSTKSYYNGLYGTISYYYNVKEGAGSCVTIFPKN